MLYLPKLGNVVGIGFTHFRHQLYDANDYTIVLTLESHKQKRE